MGATYRNRTDLTRETTELRPRRITRQEKWEPRESLEVLSSEAKWTQSTEPDEDSETESAATRNASRSDSTRLTRETTELRPRRITRQFDGSVA